MAEQKTPVALVGFGYWGKKIYSELVKNGMDVVVCDLLPVELPGKAKKIHLNDLLSNSKISKVFLATPEQTHFGLSKQLLKHHKDIFVEKPLALEEFEAKELIDLANTQDLVLWVDYIFEFDPAVQAIKSLLASHSFGEILKIESYRHSVGFQKNGIDVSDDLLIHDLYLGERLFQQQIRSIVTHTLRRHHGYVTSARYTLKWEKLDHQKKLISHCSWDEVSSAREMIIYGDLGSLCWTKQLQGKDRLILKIMGQPDQVITIPTNQLSSLAASISYFLENCSSELAEVKQVRYASYLRHTSLLASARLPR